MFCIYIYKLLYIYAIFLDLYVYSVTIVNQIECTQLVRKKRQLLNSKINTFENKSVNQHLFDFTTTCFLK